MKYQRNQMCIPLESKCMRCRCKIIRDLSNRKFCKLCVIIKKFENKEIAKQRVFLNREAISIKNKLRYQMNKKKKDNMK